MKSRTRWIAAQDARVGSWTSDDLEAARILANETPRVHAQHGKAPDELWKSRQPIRAALRDTFRGNVGREVLELKAEAHSIFEGRLSPPEEQDLERTAIRRALVAHGILPIRRKEIPPPQKLIFRAKIA